jgi:hypothetical protein
MFSKDRSGFKTWYELAQADSIKGDTDENF